MSAVCWYAPTSTVAFLFRLRLFFLLLFFLFFLRFSALPQLFLLLLLLLSVRLLIAVFIFSLPLSLSRARARCIPSVSTVQTSPSPSSLSSPSPSVFLTPRPFLRARLQPYPCLLHSCLGLSLLPAFFFVCSPRSLLRSRCCAGLLISNRPSTPVPFFFTNSPLLFFSLFSLFLLSFLFFSFPSFSFPSFFLSPSVSVCLAFPSETQSVS